MSSSSSSSYRRYNQDVSNKTHCDCKPPHPIPIQTAWTTDNPGRRFRGCPIRDKSKKCGVYGFLDLELPSDYYKGLVYSLHEENKALKRMNRMPVGVMDGTSGVVSNNSFVCSKDFACIVLAWNVILWINNISSALHADDNPQGLLIALRVGPCHQED
ncbi:hypothetical protein Tco_1378449 [Tanacetum coccineum]